jgi:xanthine dehydrogenase YagS FAD-binding subunit
MTPFAYARPTSLPDALRALAEPRSVPVGGGTDLLVCIEEGLSAPTQVVDVRALPGSRDIGPAAADTGGTGTDAPYRDALRIGGAVRIADLAAHDGIRARYPLLAEAAASVGTPALRNMGTLAGNLLQRPRCWYLRRGVACFKNGGSGCPAVEGEHPYHGIVDSGPCRAVHPSDPAVALAALDALVEIAATDGTRRTIGIEDLYDGAASNPAGESVLAAGELITAVILPAAAGGGTQHWQKLMQRGAWDFALVSCAAARRVDGTVRLVLGGVAASPWRIAHSVEEDVASGGLDDDSMDALAERALYDTAPLAGTGYKVEMARAALVRAMRALGGGAKP